MIKRVFFFLLFLSASISFSQNAVKSFFKLSRPEKCWVIFHPFAALKVMDLAGVATYRADSLKCDKTFDGDLNGGQLDAFRHAYWMALNVQKISRKKAEKLGVKHEKGNYLDFKKRKNEDCTLPDSVSCAMDLFNNRAGLEIGLKNRGSSEQELVEAVKSEVLNGNLKKIKKDQHGNLIDCDGKLIEKEAFKAKWNSTKCLIKSNE
ncbi:MAG TPA: hypothetical protein DEA97_17820 [Bacteroidales bacterium]|nr:hypothetical protein [Bacteroidales bacterium]